MADLDHSDPYFAYLAEGNARQARKRVAADVLVRDDAGRILLVDPTYKPCWDLPGGMAEANESPRTAARRELAEELGLDLTIGRPLAIDWVGPHGPWDDQIVFVLDGGVLAPDVVRRLRVTDPELAGWEFVDIDEATNRLRDDIAARLRRAHYALQKGRLDYHERRP